ncbi:O-antigen ligase [uncultured Microbulbifer sp.]|uniref:O-antigen ligase family protein n=1 Tax=uncultured Microbulbifer sp. TaxID=348147 RepID=UPI0026257091|nr:O-antigen ligase family protein [uncultured Microbulbifer sp.]
MFSAINCLLTRVRSFVFTVLAVGLFFSPVYFSIGNPWFPFNYYSAMVSLTVAAGLIILYQYDYEKIVFSAVPGAIPLGLLLLMFSIAWIISGTLIFFVDRYFVIICMLALYLSVSELYQKDVGLFLSMLRVKLAVIVGVAISFAVFVFLLQDPSLEGQVKRQPPIYQDLRHFNYDLYFALPVLVFLLKDNLRSLGLILFAFILCVTAVWTAGRGMMLALMASYTVVRLRLWNRPPQKLEIVCFFILICSLLLILVTGKTVFLYDTTLKTVASDSLNQLSSKRIDLWMASLDAYLQQDVLAQVFGMAPDAFARYGVWRAGSGQPHSSLVQFLIEFGAIGLILFIGLSVSLVKKSLYLIIYSESDTDLLAASLLVGGLVFGLVDGIFYHTAPMVMMVLVISFVILRYHSLTTGSSSRV